jgi:serine/threonine protein kinase
VRQRLAFARDAAAAVAFLHAFSPTPCAHRDVKTPNFFICESPTEEGAAQRDAVPLIAKLGDFGDLRSGKSDLRRDCGTPQWAAPEVGGAAGYDARADVFSLAVVLWELVTGLVPYEGMPGVSVRALVIGCRARPPVPALLPRPISHLIRSAWHSSPDARPSAAVIANLLQRMLDDL